jgi:hypothetical protein
VYVPDELKQRIEYTARVQRKSVAQVIRDALDAYALDVNSPRPTFPLFRSGAPIEDWDDALREFGED